MNKVRCELLKVNPVLAKQWLETKAVNRTISRRKIVDWARAMKKKEWYIAEFLKFNTRGQLVDGQHRLEAVILSNMEVEFLVAYGIEDEAVHVLDRGLNRSMANVGQLLGHTWIKPKHIAVFNKIFYCLPNYSETANRLTDQEKITAVVSLKDSFELCFKYGSINNAPLRAVITRAYFSDKVTDKNLLSDFLAIVNGYDYQDNPELFSQTRLSPSAPRKLRDIFLGKKWNITLSGRSLTDHQCYITQKALDNYLRNKITKKLSLSMGNLFPVDFIDKL